MIVDELIKSLKSILFKKFVTSLDMTSVIESSILCQSIKNDELVEHNHRHEKHDDDIVDFEEHIADHNDLEEHIADHSDHEERSSTEKHLRRHNERRIEAHREHSVINERRIEARER
jgi:ABC-type Zn2+ transport system substrate-binding protein/surface adhesin